MSLNVTFLEFVRPVSGRAGPPFFWARQSSRAFIEPQGAHSFRMLVTPSTLAMSRATEGFSASTATVRDSRVAMLRIPV